MHKLEHTHTHIILPASFNVKDKSIIFAVTAGQVLNAEQLQWGQTSVSQLHLSKTGVTQKALSLLSYLPQMHLLDIR